MDYLNYPVSQNKLKRLRAKMAQLKIREADLIERFVRSAGPGGQKVNKTSSCVYLKHKPTAIEVKCQSQRSQAQNRFLARKILVSKIEALQLKEKNERQKQIEKIRRQKRKRAQWVKEKILEIKRQRAQKKYFRRIKPTIEDY